jgi:hypothetical protein
MIRSDSEAREARGADLHLDVKSVEAPHRSKVPVSSSPFRPGTVTSGLNCYSTDIVMQVDLGDGAGFQTVYEGVATVCE